MKLRKNVEKRLRNADFYQLFIIDKDGVGYVSQSSKRGVTENQIITLISRMEKEKQYLLQMLEKGNVVGVS